MSQNNTLLEIEQIQQWSVSKDYTVGLRLYSALIGEDVLYRVMLNGGYNSYNARKLHEAMEQKRKELAAKLEHARANEPKDLAEMRRMAGRLMNERTALKAQIRVTDIQDKRKEWAFRVLDIADELDKIYGQIDFWERHGYAWEPPSETEQEQDIVRRYLNLRTYISRTKSDAEACIFPEKKQQLLKKLSELKAEKLKLELTQEIKRYKGETVT